jgi:restriction system protein
MADSTIWGIHAGRTGDADSLLLQKKLIALGWDEFGDLSQCTTREEFKSRYAKVYEGSKPGAVATNAGQLYRFVHELKPGDLVVYPAKVQRELNVGRVTGPYQYRPDIDSGYPNQRPVEWVRVFKRTDFSQGALFEVGSAMSLFQIKTYADEFLSALSGQPAAAPVANDETVALVAGEIEEQTRDFVLKRLSQELKGTPLEEFIAQLLRVMGYKAGLTPTNEPSVDLIAHKDELGLEPPIIRVQVKSGDGKTADRDVSALYGKVGPGEYGLLIALGSFTPPAIQFAGTKSNLRLIDGTELVNLIFEHYEKLDSRFKGLIPLKRVYIPESALSD